MAVRPEELLVWLFLNSHCGNEGDRVKVVPRALGEEAGVHLRAGPCVQLSRSPCSGSLFPLTTCQALAVRTLVHVSFLLTEGKPVTNQAGVRVATNTPGIVPSAATHVFGKQG